jgi:hypothetical protein
MWNHSISTPTKDSEFSDAEVSRITAAVETRSYYNVGANRRWLEPLVDMFFSVEAQ